MPCYSPYYVETPKAAALGYSRGIPVPCGKCPNCKRRRVAEWAFRLRKEDEISPAAFFVTLTYISAPMSANGMMTLKPRDLTLFWKRLRKAGHKFRYYAVGEYGTLRKRPHYHAIVFMADAITQTDFHVACYQAWALGQVDVGSVSGASIAYTLKYIDKPSRIPEHPRDDRVKEFSRSSNNLGANYMTDDIKDYHNTHLDKLYVLLDGYKVPMSKYYRDRILSPSSKSMYPHIVKRAIERADSLQVVDLQRSGDFRPLSVIRAEARVTDDKNFYKSQKIRDV